MLTPAQIGFREREILTAVIETYISTGEPVGSRTLSRLNKDGLSPATIRNVMADLVDAGFLEQPHTSAGRVPTAQAYRYYVDQISGKAVLSPADQTLISDTLHGTIDVQEFLERTSHVLSLVSSGVGVAIAAVDGCSVIAAAAAPRAMVRPAFKTWPSSTDATSGAYTVPP